LVLRIVNKPKFKRECMLCMEMHVSKTMVVEWHLKLHSGQQWTSDVAQPGHDHIVAPPMNVAQLKEDVCVDRCQSICAGILQGVLPNGSCNCSQTVTRNSIWHYSWSICSTTRQRATDCGKQWDISLSTHRKSCKYAMETPILPHTKKLKPQPSARKVMVFSDTNGPLMLAFKTLTSPSLCYCGTSENFVLPSRESVLACSWKVSQCCMISVPMWPVLSICYMLH
jgi:hypothetical protein